MDELERCPFCGCPAVIEPMKVRKGYEADVHCNGCLASIHTTTYDTEEEAVAEGVRAWNKRVAHGDLISRGALISEFEWLKSVVNESSKVEVEETIQRIRMAPAAVAASVVHGHWIRKKSPWIENCFICSICREQVETTKRKLKFCPECGAKMDLEG